MKNLVVTAIIVITQLASHTSYAQVTQPSAAESYSRNATQLVRPHIRMNLLKKAPQQPTVAQKAAEKVGQTGYHMAQNMMVMFIVSLSIAIKEVQYDEEQRARFEASGIDTSTAALSAAVFNELINGFDLYLGMAGGAITNGITMKTISLVKYVAQRTGLTLSENVIQSAMQAATKQMSAPVQALSQSVATSQGKRAFSILARSGAASFVTFVGWEAGMQLWKESMNTLTEEEYAVAKKLKFFTLLSGGGTDEEKAVFSKLTAQSISLLTFADPEKSRLWLYNTWRFKIATGEFLTLVATMAAAGAIGGSVALGFGALIGFCFGLIAGVIGGIIHYMLPQEWKDYLTFQLQGLRYGTNAREQGTKHNIMVALRFGNENHQSMIPFYLNMRKENRSAAVTAAVDSIIKRFKDEAQKDIQERLESPPFYEDPTMLRQATRLLQLYSQEEQDMLGLQKVAQERNLRGWERRLGCEVLKVKRIREKLGFFLQGLGVMMTPTGQSELLTSQREEEAFIYLTVIELEGFSESNTFFERGCDIADL